MQAYATAERPDTGARLRSLNLTAPERSHRTEIAREQGAAVLDHLLVQLADLVVDRLIARTTDADAREDEWMDARDAAEHLGVHRDTLRKLAAQRAIPFQQDGPGCKLYFRRDELDEWRRSAGRSLRVV